MLRFALVTAAVLLAAQALAEEPAPPARAADATSGEDARAERPALLEEIVVKGKRLPRVDGLEGREIRETPARDLGEALSQQGLSAVVRKGAVGSDIVIRGFQREAVTVTIDGAKLHGACPNRMDPPAFHVDYAEVDRVELRKGPFDVTSAGGIGGAVDVRTRSPGQGVSGEIGVGYGRFEAMDLSATLGWGTERGGLLGGAALKQGRPFESGDGLRITELYPASSPNRYRPDALSTRAYDMGSGWAKGTFSPRPGHRAELSIARQDTDRALYPYLRMDARYDDATRANVAYEAARLGPLARLRAQAFFSRVLHDMDDVLRCSAWETVGDCTTTLPRGWSMRTLAESWNGGAALEAGLPTPGETTAGVDLNVRGWNAETTRYRRMGTPGYFDEDSIPDVRTVDVGLHVRHEVSLGERVDVRAGVRLDLARSDAGDDRSAEYAKYYADLPDDLRRDDALLSGNLQVDVRLGRGVTGFVGYGHGVRVPDPQERYFALSPMGPAGPGTVGLPTLEPVKNDEVDLGARLVAGPLLVKAQVFHSWVTDHVAVVEVAQLADPTLRAKSYANVDARLWGGEASVRAALARNVYATASIAYTRGENETAGGPLAEVPPLRGAAALRYDRRAWFAEVEGVLADDQTRVDEAVREQPTGGWAILNLKAGARLAGLELMGGVRNVFDRLYYESLSHLRDPFATGIRVPEPGRVAYLSARYGF